MKPIFIDTLIPLNLYLPYRLLLDAEIKIYFLKSG